MVLNIKNVLIVDEVGDECERILRLNNVEVKKMATLSETQLIDEILNYDAIVVRFSTKVTLDAIIAGKNLKVIACAGVYFGNVDRRAAENYGVGVINAPKGDKFSVCEFTCCLTLALAKRMIKGWNDFVPNVWHKSIYRGSELHCRIIGFIGFGDVARQVARRLKIFNTILMAYDPRCTKELGREYSATLTEMKNIWPIADYIIYISPPFDSLSVYIDAEMIRAFKKGVKLVIVGDVNCVDLNAMWDALNIGQIRSVAFDLYDEDLKLLEKPIFRHPEVIASMHQGVQTEEAVNNSGREAAEQLVNLCWPNTYNTTQSTIVNFPKIASRR